MAVFGLVCRRLAQRTQISPAAVARATLHLRPHALLEPRFPPPAVFGGRACSSNAIAPQSSNATTPQSPNATTPQLSNGITPQSSKVVTFPPSPAPLLPKGYSEDLDKLSDNIADLEADFKLLFHMIWVLYGLLFAVLLKLPGTLGDLDGKTSDLGARVTAVAQESKWSKEDLARLEDEVVQRNATKVASQSTPSL